MRLRLFPRLGLRTSLLACAYLGFVIDIACAADSSSATDAAEPAGEWRMQAHDYANTRYSTLDAVNTQNVKQLRIAWTFSDGALYGHEGAPLVIGSTMCVVGSWPMNSFLRRRSVPPQIRTEKVKSDRSASSEDRSLRGFVASDQSWPFADLHDRLLRIAQTGSWRAYSRSLDSVTDAKSTPNY